MTLSLKRPWRVQEFTAHDECVNCLAFGHKSGQILVTGGEDKKVNFWAVGQQKCLLSLSGHSSPVEAVCFGRLEDVVAAGSLSGSLKIWDLEASKMLVTLMGHRASIKSVNFHPYGNFIASGSSDTNVKVWDLRKKGCVSTYKGHSGCVNCVKFSPDGSWLATAGEDNLVKLWDIGAGQLQTEFRDHSSPVNCLDFHPQELVLASGSDDRTIKFWNLDSMRLAKTVAGVYSPIRSMLFDQEGLRLYAGAHNALKVFAWQSTDCLDSLALNWADVADMAITGSYLVGASYLQANISAFVVDVSVVTRCKALREALLSYRASRGITQCYLPYTSDQTNVIAPPNPSQKVPVGTVEHCEMKSAAPANTKKARKQSSTTRDISCGNASPANQPAPKQNEMISEPVTMFNWAPASARSLPPPSPSAPPCHAADLAKTSVDDAAVKPRQSSTRSFYRSTSGTAIKRTGPRMVTKVAVRGVASSQPGEASGGVAAWPRTTAGGRLLVSRELSLPVETSLGGPVPSSTRHRQLSRAFHGAKSSSSAAFTSDITRPPLRGGDEGDATLKLINEGHSTFLAHMMDRLHCLNTIKQVLHDGNFKAALETASMVDDDTLMCDLLGVLVRRPKKWKLDLELCTVLLPVAQSLVKPKYDLGVNCAMTVTEMVVKNFAGLIKTTIAQQAPTATGNVDIAAEERYERCKACDGLMVSMYSVLKSHRCTGTEVRRKQTKILELLSQAGFA